MTKRVTAWSYSRWSDHAKCAALYKYKYIEKLPEAESEALERGSAVHLQIAQYLRGDLPPNDPIAGWTYFEALYRELRDMDPSIEQEWGFTDRWTPTGWFADDTWFRSKLDCFLPYDDDTADIIDFKTGKPRPETSMQAELYAVSAFRKRKNLQAVTVRFWYVDLEQEGKEVVYRFNREMAGEIIAKWTKRAEKVLMDKIFAPNPAYHCNWCAYSKKKGGPCKYG
jgi:hypothetical protein